MAKITKKEILDFIKGKEPLVYNDGGKQPTAMIFLRDDDEINIHYGSGEKKQKRIAAFMDALNEIDSCDCYEVEEGAHILADIIYGEKDCYSDPEDKPDEE